VILDPSHARGSVRSFRAGARGVAIGADGLIVEVHPARRSDQRRCAVARLGAVRKDDEGTAAIHCIVEGNEAAGSRSGELRFHRDVHGDRGNYEKNRPTLQTSCPRENFLRALRADANVKPRQ